MLPGMPKDAPPHEITALARDRAAARRARDWTTADRMRAEIESAGWRIVDSGTSFTLHPAAPPTVKEDGRVRYGSSEAVPSRLDEAAVGTASIVLLASQWPDDLARTYRALTHHAPDGTQLIVVANAPSDAQAGQLDGLDAADPGAPGIVTEVVWTSTERGHAAALNAGIRRAVAPIVLLIDTSVEAQGDIVTPLAASLDDPSVAIAGPFGIVSGDLRRFEDAPDDAVDVDAIQGYLLAFRRSDYVERGPLDEHFAFYRNLDIWWSLVLRDEGEDEGARRAVRVPGLPLERHAHRGWLDLDAQERDRRSKRNFYRILKRFATRRDLLVGAVATDPDGAGA
jgi:hypothetical protein